MTILTELNKLKLSKTQIRKSIQRKGTDLTLSEIYPQYYTYIQSMSDTRTPDEAGLKDYVEDRCYSIELSVNKIRSYAFRGYSCLQELYLNNTNVVELENINAFYGISPKILVPASLLSQYKTANNWSKISDQIYAYAGITENEMYIIQHMDKVQTVSWIESKNLSEIQREFRNEFLY